MEHVVEVDGQAEAEGRRLLLAAFGAAGPGPDERDGGDGGDGLAGAELLRAVRRRTARRRRTRRALLPAGAVTALAGAAVAVTLTATVASAPSAAASVTAAAAKTSTESFRVTMSIATNPPPGVRNGRVQAAQVTGAFDPARGVGQETVSGPWKFLVRYVGQSMYLDTLPGSRQVVFSNGQGSRPWAEFPSERALSGNEALWAAASGPGSAPPNPVTLLGLLKSAGLVTADGQASGPGWTGTKYRFTVTVAQTGTVGYVDVDGHGRVRRLVADLDVGTGKARWVMASEDVTFGDFGASISVGAPPASQVYLLKAPVAMIALGW